MQAENIFENELFSIRLPEGWVCDSSQWEGLASLRNEVDFYNPKGDVVALHVVKTFFPFHWKSIDEAKEMALFARSMSEDSVELYYEQDSLEVGGYPACLLVYKIYENGNAMIQKQFVTYLDDSHITMYFNEWFDDRDFRMAQKKGDEIISSIRLKSVANPLDNDSIMKKAVEEGSERHPADEKDIMMLQQLEQTEQE